jgi:hypothetical protein
VFILNEDAAMGRLRTARFIHEGDGFPIAGERVEDQLSAFTAPDFDDVDKHVFIFIIVQADGNAQPCDGDFVPIPRCAEHGCRRVIGAVRQFGRIGVNDGQGFEVTVNREKLDVDPAIIFCALHPNPVVSASLSD